MKIYILTQEPYHDNSTILSVHTNEDIGIAALKGCVDSTDINCDDARLTEWDLDIDEEGRSWEMRGNQISDGVGGWHPIRKDFTFCERLKQP